MHANLAEKPRLSLESTVRVLHRKLHARAFPSEELLPVYPRRLEVMASIHKAATLIQSSWKLLVH
eukprot:5036225-Amphidinium_carterae.1